MLYQLSYAHHGKFGRVLRPKAGTVFVPATAFYTISAPRWNWTLLPQVVP
jgi:hypothetical protein